MKIILASTNAGKLQELQASLAVLNITLIPQRDLELKDADETAVTFIENALIKARHACVQTGLPAIADDSGLCVPALQGAPGVNSSRYSGGSDQDNIKKLLKAMQGLKESARDAFFHCVLVYLACATDPAPYVCHGMWRGSILEEAVGDSGFGYDPIFYVPTHRVSASQLSITQKNEISHRGKALQQFISQWSLLKG